MALAKAHPVGRAIGNWHGMAWTKKPPVDPPGQGSSFFIWLVAVIEHIFVYGWLQSLGV